MDTLIVAVLSFAGFIVPMVDGSLTRFLGLRIKLSLRVESCRMVSIMCQLREGLFSVTISPVLLVLDRLLDRQLPCFGDGCQRCFGSFWDQSLLARFMILVP